MPVWPDSLSARLLIIGLVGRYPANYLIRDRPLLWPLGPEGSRTFDHKHRNARGLIAYYNSFRRIIRIQRVGQLSITHPYATVLTLRLSRATCMPKPCRQRSF